MENPENASREAGVGALENGSPPRENLIRAISPGVELARADDGDTADPTMVGHFAVFNRWTEINSVFEGRFMERFAPGAFTKTFSEGREGMRVLFQHGFDPVVGDKPLGPIRLLEEDTTGARYEVPLLDAPYVRDNVLPGLEAGLYGASFRFKVMKEEFVDKPRRSKHNPDGLPERTVTEAQVREFGPVTFPAYATATAGIRSLTDEFMFGRFIDDPERLRELIEATVQTRSNVEPEQSAVTTPPDQEPEPSAATTPPEPTRETIRLPAPKKETSTMTADERRVRVAEIGARFEEIHAEFGADPLPDDIQNEWDNLKQERSELNAAIKAYEDRMAVISEAAKDERKTETEARTVSTFHTRRPGRKIPSNAFDVAEYRSLANSLDELPGMYRDGALEVLEDAGFAHPEAEHDKCRTHVERLLRVADAGHGELAERMLVTGSPTYQRAFGKTLMSQPLNAEEQRALSMTTTAGGFAVPYTLDPTIIPTSNGVVNPLRQISRIETITVNEWRGVSSAGVTASYGAEASEAGDNAPTLAQPTANVEKAVVNIPYSIEIGQDWNSLQTEMARMIQDAKDELEATKFVAGVGHGSNEPEGLLVGGTAVVSTSAATALAVADLFSLEEALPPRFRPRASIVGSKNWFNRVRRLDTTGGSSLWARIGEATPARLLDYPAYELSSYSSAITSGASVLTIGDFSHFLIVDRVGMTVEIIPHLFATANNRPSGQRSLYAYWRNTSDVLAWQAFRTLKVT